MVLSKGVELLAEGRLKVGVTPDATKDLVVRSKEPNGVEKLGEVCDNKVDTNASEPTGKGKQR